jgi:hypothetical protein
MRSFAEQRDFKALLLADPDVRRAIGPAEIERAFDLDEQFRHLDEVFDRVFRSEGKPGPGLDPELPVVRGNGVIQAAEKA